MADDIKITNNRLLLENGDLQLVRGINRIIQHISVGLRIIIGDWVLDNTVGIDYFGGMRAYSEIMSAQIKRSINIVDGVDTVLKYSFYEDKNNYFQVASTIKIGNSEIAVNDAINSTALGVNTNYGN